MGGTDDRAERDPGLVVGSLGMVGGDVLVCVRSLLARLAVREVVEEAKAPEASTQAVQEAKAIRGVDAEAGVCGVLGGSGGDEC